RQPISVICLDIDHFKRVNDDYGHTVGDEVLKALVHCIRGHLRANDHLARLGGEEFSLILPETTLEGATALAERLRVSIQETPAAHEEGVIQYTCSFGTAQRLRHDESLDSMLNRADRALYEAKRGGRNQVRAAAESAPVPVAIP
ncbi:MAG: GGDEF domain-containing protein, partial [Actinomycetota bacterium]